MPFVVIVGVLIIAIIGISTSFPGIIKVYDKCDEAAGLYSLSLSGIVTEKKDSDPHSRSRYLVVESSGREELIVLLHDNIVNKKTRKSFLWEVLNVADSIKKEVGTFEVSYKKSGQEWRKHKLGFKLCE